MELNSISQNHEIWTTYDWEQAGKEWVRSLEWKNSLLSATVAKYFSKNSTLLEIGCGYGEWSQNLLHFSEKLILVDIVTKCIEYCEKRFAGYPFVEVYETNGDNLNIVPDNSVDGIFAMHCLVQSNSGIIQKYIEEFSRILVSGGIAIIHHSKNGINRDFRSDMTAEDYAWLSEENGMEVVDQLTIWDDGRHQLYDGTVDVISITRKR